MTTKRSDRGIVRLANQSWPATSIGGREFRRTQSKVAPWLRDVAKVWVRWCAGDEPGMVVETSGTTGSPKVVSHARASVLASVNDTIQHWHLVPGTRAAMVLPATFVAGQAMLIRALEGAWDLTLVQPSSQPAWDGAMDFVAMTPHQADGWLERGSGSTQTLLLGGGPVSRTLLDKLLNSNRAAFVWESYGLSETITHVAARPLKDLDGLEGAFVPLPSATIGVNDDGCAVVHAPSRGIHHLPTNDCIEELPAGGFRWLGRADDVINSGGVLVHPQTVERAFESIMPAWVSDWAAFGKADDALGEAVVLRVDGQVPQGTHPETWSSDWRVALKGILGPAKTPRRIEWGSLPRTERGKLNRRWLAND